MTQLVRLVALAYLRHPHAFSQLLPTSLRDRTIARCDGHTAIGMEPVATSSIPIETCHITFPPFGPSIWPVRKLDASEARNSADSATSLVEPRRRSGNSAARFAFASSLG